MKNKEMNYYIKTSLREINLAAGLCYSSELPDEAHGIEVSASGKAKFELYGMTGQLEAEGFINWGTVHVVLSKKSRIIITNCEIQLPQAIYLRIIE